MRRIALCLACLVLALSARGANAATYHVDPNTGSDANSGTTHSTAWGTVTKANGVIAPGSVVYLWPGAHSGLPNPSAGATGGQRFTFIGASANGDPVRDTLVRATITVQGGTLSKPYVVYKGFTVTSTLTL